MSELQELQEFRNSLIKDLRCSINEYIEGVNELKQRTIDLVLVYSESSDNKEDAIKDLKLEIERFKLTIKIISESFTKKDVEIYKLLDEYKDKKYRKPVKAILNKIKKEYDFIN